MKYPKFVVLVLAIALTAALLMPFLPGCSMFGDSGDKSVIAKTVAKSALKLIVAAYQSGGSSLAAAKIDAMEADGKLTTEQATALKGMVDSSVTALKDLANDSPAKAPTNKDTAGTSTEVNKNTFNMLIINKLQCKHGNKNISVKACFTSPMEPIADANIKV